MSTQLGDRFSQSTRGRVLALLRSAPRTVDELAGALQLTDNAVRPHLVALERDGLIRQSGVRRGGSVGKPAVIFELRPDAEPLMSRAYAPVLMALLDVLAAELPDRQLRKLLRATGRRVAADVARHAGDFHARARAAAELLTSLGGAVEAEEHRGVVTLRGEACPLGSAVARESRTCEAVQALVAEISGASVQERCDRGGRPRCCFELRPR